MTAAGRLEREFAEFKEEVEKRLAALEGGKTVKATPVVEKTTSKKTKDVVIEAKNGDIVATEV